MEGVVRDASERPISRHTQDSRAQQVVEQHKVGR